jgi:hypothetical protein
MDYATQISQFQNTYDEKVNAFTTVQRNKQARAGAMQKEGEDTETIGLPVAGLALKAIGKDAFALGKKTLGDIATKAGEGVKDYATKTVDNAISRVRGMTGAPKAPGVQDAILEGDDDAVGGLMGAPTVVATPAATTASTASTVVATPATTTATTATADGVTANVVADGATDAGVAVAAGAGEAVLAAVGTAVPIIGGIAALIGGIVAIVKGHHEAKNRPSFTMPAEGLSIPSYKPGLSSS